MMESNKEKIKKLVKKMLIKSHHETVKNIDKVLDSGCIDVDGWDDECAPMIIPKAIVIAILIYEARSQYAAIATSVENQIKKEVENIHCFL